MGSVLISIMQMTASISWQEIHAIRSAYHITVTRHDRHGISNHRQLHVSFQQLVQAVNKWDVKTPLHWPFVRGISRWLANSPHKRPIMRGSFHTMTTSWLTLLTRGTSSHYTDVIMGAIASQITSLPIVYSIVYSDADQRKHQSSASLAFVREIHRGPVNSPHKWPVTRKMFPFDDVIVL